MVRVGLLRSYTCMLPGKYCQSIDIQLEPYVFRVGLLRSCTCMVAGKYYQHRYSVRAICVSCWASPVMYMYGGWEVLSKHRYSVRAICVSCWASPVMYMYVGLEVLSKHR